MRTRNAKRAPAHTLAAMMSPSKLRRGAAAPDLVALLPEDVLMHLALFLEEPGLCKMTLLCRDLSKLFCKHSTTTWPRLVRAVSLPGDAEQTIALLANVNRLRIPAIATTACVHDGTPRDAFLGALSASVLTRVAPGAPRGGWAFAWSHSDSAAARFQALQRAEVVNDLCDIVKSLECSHMVLALAVEAVDRAILDGDVASPGTAFPVLSTLRFGLAALLSAMKRCGEAPPGGWERRSAEDMLQGAMVVHSDDSTPAPRHGLGLSVREHTAPWLQDAGEARRTPAGRAQWLLSAADAAVARLDGLRTPLRAARRLVIEVAGKSEQDSVTWAGCAYLSQLLLLSPRAALAASRGHAVRWAAAVVAVAFAASSLGRHWVGFLLRTTGLALPAIADEVRHVSHLVADADLPPAERGSFWSYVTPQAPELPPAEGEGEERTCVAFMHGVPFATLDSWNRRCKRASWLMRAGLKEIPATYGFVPCEEPLPPFRNDPTVHLAADPTEGVSALYGGMEEEEEAGTAEA